jgi:glycosyltransferase involved in cell wall biosynthesis
MKISWHIAVLVPARDEEDLLPRCLRSIERARAALPPNVSSDLIVVSDQSTDDTYRTATNLVQHSGLVVEVSAGCVGTARALAAEIALQRYQGPLHQCWLANTDADCEVPASWLVDQLATANAGFSAIAGIIGVDSFEEHEPIVAERFRQSYLIHPDGTHPHVHGANLGMRADAYLQAGGWRDLATAEDHDLWRRLHNKEHRRIADARLRVTTSGRRKGRAPLGFAGALAAHNEVAL